MGGCCSCAKGKKAVHPEPDVLAPVLPIATAAASCSGDGSSARSAIAPVVADTSQVAKATQSEPVATAPELGANIVVGTAESSSSRPKSKVSLIKAVKENNLALMDELIHEGAGLEDLGMWDQTPLLAACTYGHTEAALKLIGLKANVWARNEHDATPMHYASIEGSLNVVEALLSAARSDGAEACPKLVNCGPAKLYNRHLDAYARRLPLAAAAESGFSEVTTLLLESGAHIEGVAEDGKTALWLASRHSRFEVMRLLLQHRADTNVKDEQGQSVIHAATLAGHEELILALLTHGVANVNDTVGYPLRDAVKAGKRRIVEALLTHGAAVQPSEGGAPADKKTPLHAACEKGDEYLVALLVRARADPSLRDAADLTAFDLLRRRGLGDAQIVTLLSPPAAQTMDGSTGGAVVDATEDAEA